MRRLWAALLCVALACAVCVPFAPADTARAASVAVVTAPAAVMRVEPRPGACARRILHAGARVDVLSSMDGYLWVSADGAPGFIPAGAVSRSGEGADAGGVQRGQSGLMVTWLQNALRQMGYYSGAPSGFYGLNTYRAVMAFQQDGGMRGDGVADAATREALISLTESVPSSTHHAATASEGLPYAALKRYSILESGSTGDKVSNLQQALYDRGYYAALPTGVYDALTEEAVAAFQKSFGLWADGKAGEQTQALLYSDTVPEPVTAQPLLAGALKPVSRTSFKENGVWVLDWDSGDVERVFPRRAYATLIDARTGARYQVRRFQGTNHADVEMVTEEDTRIFESLWEERWSWAARPIYLEIDGELYAAAINGMPHGDITLQDNGVGGHFCIHFLNSTTHVSGESNERMQDAIREAIDTAGKYVTK